MLNAASIALRAYSEEDLLEELVRRKNERKASRPEQWCEDCTNFKPCVEDAPDTYNPCSKGHEMHFWMPVEYDINEYGFYRRVCGDRQEAGTPSPSSC